MRFFAIVLLAVLAGVGYGIVHDLITVRVSLEYFTVGHPPIFNTTSPTQLALGWGVLATWWVALPLGFLLAAVSQNGRTHPPLSIRIVVRLMSRLLAAMAAAALVGSTMGFVLATRDLLELQADLASAIPLDRHDRFIAARWAHGASYLVGIVGGLVTIAMAWRERRA